MSESELSDLKNQPDVAFWRLSWAERVESNPAQTLIIGTILVNSIILGMETSSSLMEMWGTWLVGLDRLCLGIFIVELVIKGLAYQGRFLRSPWNIFDLLVVLVALVPGAGPWAVLRTLRVLRVLRLLTVVPSLRKVVAAFLHSIPGLAGVGAIMAIFFYTAAVLTTKLFGVAYPEWFGSIGRSLYTLFQIMTLESWSMGIVRPVMERFPLAWLFFVPFIIVATFTILNLFIGIIVSSMQELSIPKPPKSEPDSAGEILDRIERDIERLKQTYGTRS